MLIKTYAILFRARIADIPRHPFMPFHSLGGYPIMKRTSFTLCEQKISFLVSNKSTRVCARNSLWDRLNTHGQLDLGNKLEVLYTIPKVRFSLVGDRTIVKSGDLA